MEKVFAKAEALAGNVKEYVKTNIELAKLEAVEKGSIIVAGLIEKLITGVILFFFLALASVALAIFLGDAIGKTWAGFLIVAGIYLVVGLIVWSARKKIIHKPVINAFINQVFNKEDEEDK